MERATCRQTFSTLSESRSVERSFVVRVVFASCAVRETVARNRLRLLAEAHRAAVRIADCVERVPGQLWSCVPVVQQTVAGTARSFETAGRGAISQQRHLLGELFGVAWRRSSRAASAGYRCIITGRDISVTRGYNGTDLERPGRCPRPPVVMIVRPCKGLDSIRAAGGAPSNPQEDHRCPPSYPVARYVSPSPRAGGADRYKGPRSVSPWWRFYSWQHWRGPRQLRAAVTRNYPIHTGIVSTTFWVGEIFDPTAADGSQMYSTYDGDWFAHYGGCDGVATRGGCSTERRTSANAYFPTRMSPRENPFYLDLPFDDVNDRQAFARRAQVIPWANDPGYAGHANDTRLHLHEK